MNGCCPTYCKNSQHFKKNQLYFYVFMDNSYLLVFLNFYLLYQIYCCYCTLRFTTQTVTYELTQCINLQFLSLNCFTIYWMSKHVSEAVQRTLPVAQGENSTIFPINSSVILNVSFIITAKKNLDVHNKNLFYSRGCRFSHSQHHSAFRPCTSRTVRKSRMTFKLANRLHSKNVQAD